MTRRNWIQLDGRGTSCIVVNDKSLVTKRLFAYELSTLKRKAPSRRDEEVRARVEAALAGTCVYAFYAKPTHHVKLGMATNIQRRWRELENGSGMPIQLVSVWKTNQSRAFEAALHTQFAEHRTLGEWFAADPVIEYIRSYQ